MAFGWRKQFVVRWNLRVMGGIAGDGPVRKSSPTVRNQLPEPCSPRPRPGSMVGPFDRAVTKS